MLRTFYGGKAFAPKQAKKRRFLLARRKQAFEEQVINELIAKSERGSSTPAVFAYGDGQFASSMQGCHGGTPHARLRRLLAMKRRVVLVDEYLTTKRCPTCRCFKHHPSDGGGVFFEEENWGATPPTPEHEARPCRVCGPTP